MSEVVEEKQCRYCDAVIEYDLDGQAMLPVECNGECGENCYEDMDDGDPVELRFDM